MEEPQSQTVEPHSAVTLSCKTEPNNAQISWMFNGAFIDSIPQLDVEVQAGALHIASFRYKPKDQSHVGVYQCMAQTPGGAIVSKEAVLQKAGELNTAVCY